MAGFGDSLATAFNQGGQNAINYLDARNKQAALVQDQVNSQIQQAQDSIKATLDSIDKSAQSQATNSPAWDTSTAQAKAQIDDTISVLRGLNTKAAVTAANSLSQQVNLMWPQIVKTASERNMDNMKLTQTKEDQVKQFVDKQFAVQGKDNPDQAVSPSIAAPAPAPDLTSPGPGIPAPQMAASGPAPAPAATPPVMSQAQATPDQSQPQAAPAPAPAPAPAEVSPNAVSKDQLDEWRIDAQKRRAYDDAHDSMLGAPSKDELDNRKQARTDFYKLKPDAVSAAAGFAELNKAKELLPNIISGKFAETKLAVGKAIGTESNDAIKATESFQALMRDQVLKRIKALGSNSAVSDTDRIFVSSMSGENIELNPNSIADILDHAQNMYRDILNSYNQDAPYYGQRQLAPKGYVADQSQGGGGVGMPQQVNLPQPDKDGWVDLGGGVRIRAVK